MNAVRDALAESRSEDLATVRDTASKVVFDPPRIKS